MAIQQGNAVCVMGCPKDTSTGLEGLFNFQIHEAEELWQKKIFIPKNEYISVYVPLLKKQNKTKTIPWCVACTNPNDRMTFRDGNFSFPAFWYQEVSVLPVNYK